MFKRPLLPIQLRDKLDAGYLPPRFWAQGEDRQMTEKLNELLNKAKSVKLSPEEKEEQRRSFAYGNTNIENSRITRETVDREAEDLKKSS
jgi:uncharacterized protein YnzC (UPF0291/DUF896 family)